MCSKKGLDRSPFDRKSPSPLPSQQSVEGDPFDESFLFLLPLFLPTCFVGGRFNLCSEKGLGLSPFDRKSPSPLPSQSDENVAFERSFLSSLSTCFSFPGTFF